jgi:hypothetical protein
MSQIYLASKTLDAINAAIELDQGGAYRQALGRVLPHIGDAYQGANEGHRSHLGASLIGGKCARAIWYGFHWAVKPKFKGQTLRLFNRGHLEEGRFIAMLLIIGAQVFQQDENGKQFRISGAGGHFGGSGDGVAIGIPDLPEGLPCLLEFKTHNDASFKKLEKEGVREAKFEHFVQMQTYMHKMNLTVALYGAVNKNNDALHLELIGYEPTVGVQFEERAVIIIHSKVPPEKISKSPGWFDCKWCDHKPHCHGKDKMEVNCRTCHWSWANTETGTWQCEHPDVRVDAIPKDVQLIGCPAHEYMREA